MEPRKIDNSKNRDREAPTFANINLLGKCNVDCFFCLGKDIEDELSRHDQTKVHFDKWINFTRFLDDCRREGITRLYITGQNTDALCYRHLQELILFLQRRDFHVGLRTNGYAALDCMDDINLCDRSVGYSIHSLNPVTNRMILNRKAIPAWGKIIPATVAPCRVQIVVNRCNAHEVFDVLRYVGQFPNVQYVQVRRVSTDTRAETLAPDIAAYENLYTFVSRAFPMHEKLWGDAEVYMIHGKPVCFWRTVKTTISSFNYFTNGVVSHEYFVIEGYLKNCGKGTRV